MSDDESISRLLAADPARGEATDLAALRRAVDTRLGAEGPAPTPAPRDELAERRARRSRRMSWVAGAAASVIVGVSGYLVGAGGAGGGGGDSAGGAAEDVGTFVASEESGASTGVSDEAGTDDTMEQADELGVISGSDGSAGGAEESGRVAFEASGLSDERTTAEAFGYDATGVATAGRAQQVADALGVAGTAAREGAAWAVTDAQGRRVAVEDDGAATFGYSDPTLPTGACADVRDDVSDPDDLGTCEVVGDPIATAGDFLAAVGVARESLELTIGASALGEVVVDGYAAGSNASGQPVWSVVVTSGGVSSATGPLAPLTSIGSYEVVSPVEAVARLGDSRFGALVTGQVTHVVAEGQGPWTPSEGATIPWAVTTHTITSADLVLAGYPLGGGALAVLPTWQLTSADGGTWSVIAVTDEFLDLGGSTD